MGGGSRHDSWLQSLLLVLITVYLRVRICRRKLAFSSGGADVRFLHHKLMCSVVLCRACGYLLSVKSPTGSQDRAELEIEVSSLNLTKL